MKDNKWIRRAEQNKWFRFIKGTVMSFLEDDCPLLAAGISYYVFFSIFPLLLVLTALLGMLIDPAEVQEHLLKLVGTYVPVAQELIISNVTAAIRARSTLGPIAAIGLLWSATGIFSALRRTVNRAWNTEKSRPFIQQKLLELSMIASIGLLLVLSLASTTAFKIVNAFELPVLGYRPFENGLLWSGLQILIPLFFTVGLFFLLYFFLPNTKVARGDAFAGAIVAGLLFELAKNLFAWYIQNLTNYHLVYDSLASVVIFLFWAYVSAIIMLLGAELSSQYSLIFGSRSTNPIKPEAIPIECAPAQSKDE
jgi:membrane protein